MSAIPFLDFASPIINKVLSYVPDPTQRAQAEKELRDSLQNWDAQQNAINVEEAKSSSLFVAGARPFILWICGLIFAYNFLIQPLLIFLLVACGSSFDPKELPVLDYANMMPVMMGMLGLAGMRSYDKMKGIA